MASPAGPHPVVASPPRTAPWDVAGLVIVGTLGGWTLVASAQRDAARPLPVLALLGACAALFVVGRFAGRRDESVVPRVVALAISGAFLITFPGVLSSGGSPTDYGNTNGTLAALGVVAATTAALYADARYRRAWTGVALLLATCVLLSESVAAAVALSAVAALALIALARRDSSVASLGGLLATWLVLGATVAVADGASDDIASGEQALRVVLWGRAIDLARHAPLRGGGPGSFAPPLAILDDDLRWAHQEYLQQAAEVGIVGLVLLMVLVAWLFAYLWWGRRRGLVRSVAGASVVTLVGLHATVDHVLHTAVIPLTVALLAGWATGGPVGRGSPGSRRPFP